MTTAAGERIRAGALATVVVLAIYGGLALSVDFPKAAVDIQSDEATYLAMGYSLAHDWDLEYRRRDLERFRAEWPNGPGGIFLKRGTDVTGVSLSTSPPFFSIEGRPDRDTTRLYFGKSFAYPLFAAPFVRFFGTNGFLVLNALLLATAFFAVYLFLSARSGVVVGLLLASSFIFASVMPVYFVWTTPELFNFSLAVLAYFLWLYKYVAPAPTTLAGGLLRASSSDWVAAAIVGLLTFSKVTNVLLLLPPVVWLLWQREWRRALAMSVVAGAVTVVFFGANVVSSGDWNYQGGDRATCYNTFPFQEERWGLDTTPGCEQRGRSTGLLDEIFDPKVFWSNLRANVGYFFVGRYGGLLAYFFPAVFAVAAFGFARGRRESWQWCVLGGVLVSIALFIVTLPYTYLGGGGSVGNRYFTAVYGLCVFLFPPMRSTAAGLVPWIVGGFFMAKLVLNPFQTSIRPFEPAKSGALRIFPVELTNTTISLYMNEGHRVRVWYGDPAKRQFQIYHYDDNAYLKEADGVSFSVRGRSRAEMLIKADPFVNGPDEPLNVQPPKMLKMTLTAGRVPTTVGVELKGGARQVHSLQPDQQWTVWLDLPKPFPFNLVQDAPRAMPASLWVLSISSSDGFSPRTYDPSSPDVRFLGVRVTPDLVR